MIFKWYMVKPHTSDIRVIYEYIWVTYGWHTSTYEWHAWHTSTYEWHTNDIRVHTSDIPMAYKYIRVTCQYIWVTYGWYTSTYEWHTDDMSTNEWYTNDIRVHTVLLLPKLKRGLELAFGEHFLHGFFIPFFFKCFLFNTLSIEKVSTSYLFTRCQTKCVIKFLFTQLMTS